MMSISGKMRAYPIFLPLFLLIWIPTSHGTVGPPKPKLPPFPHDWPPYNEIKLNGDGRGFTNIFLPKHDSGSLAIGHRPQPDQVPIYRAESSVNQRMTPKGIDGKAKLWVSVGQPQRTIEFAQQARYRANVNTAKKGEKPDNWLDANGQTIRSSLISKTTAIEVLSSAVPERWGKGKDVINGDINHAPNQLGISGKPLNKLKKEVKANGVSVGTTFGGRRNSEPTISSQLGKSRFGFTGSRNDASKLENIYMRGVESQRRHSLSGSPSPPPAQPVNSRRSSLPANSNINLGIWSTGSKSKLSPAGTLSGSRSGSAFPTIPTRKPSSRSKG